MPHTTTGTNTDNDHGWGWLSTTAPPIPLHPTTSPDPASGAVDGGEWEWITDQTPLSSPPTTAPRPRICLRAWLIAGSTVIVLAGAVTGAVLTHHTGHAPVAQPVVTAKRTASAPVSPACASLSGAIVTDRAGDSATVAGLIATFEFAYYTSRSADQAMRAVASDSGIAPQALAGGIASIPPGTHHCVAINPLAGGAADVHVVELHPDQTRVDYLQLINTRRTPAGLAISNIQGRQ